MIFLVRFFMSKSTAMVMLGRSVHLTTIFSWASLTKQLTSTFCTYFCLLLTTHLESGEGRRMTIEIIFIIKVWDWAGIRLTTPGYAVRNISAARHVTDCDARCLTGWNILLFMMGYIFLAHQSRRLRVSL